MARTKAVLGSGARLSDYLSASLLARVYPSDWVHQVLDEHGVNSQRTRSFPAMAATYYCMALSVYPESAYEDVIAVVAQGLAWMRGGLGLQDSQAVPTARQVLDQRCSQQDRLYAVTSAARAGMRSNGQREEAAARVLCRAFAARSRYVTSLKQSGIL